MGLDDHDDFFLDEYERRHTKEKDDYFLDEYEDRYLEPPIISRNKHPFRNFVIVSVLIIIGAISLFIYFRYFNPYASDVRVTGYITSVERHGIIFKTYEAQMDIPAGESSDLKQFHFSIADGSLAESLKEYINSGKTVTIIFDKYYGSLPWRGTTPDIAVEILP